MNPPLELKCGTLDGLKAYLCSLIMLLPGMPKNLLCKEELLPNLAIHGPELQASFKFNREKTISDNYVGRFENV